MRTPRVRLVVQKHQIERLRRFGNDSVYGIHPEVARPENQGPYSQTRVEIHTRIVGSLHHLTGPERRQLPGNAHNYNGLYGTALEF